MKEVINVADVFSCPGLYRCASTDVCIPLHQRCDGVYQCPQHDDERWCSSICPTSCQCRGLTYSCEDKSLVELPTDLPSVARKVILRNNSLILNDATFDHLGLLLELDISLNGLALLFPKVFEELVNLRRLDLSFNDITELGPDTFFGLQQLEFLNLEGNAHLQTIYPGAFFGLDSLPLLNLTGLALTALHDDNYQGCCL